MITRLQLCFGGTGCISMLAWVVALALCLAALRRRRRALLGPASQRPLAISLAVALLALALTSVHSRRIDAIRLDRSDELVSARAAQERMQAREEQARLASGERLLRFAEDAPGETIDTVETAPVSVQPSYQSAGKQERTAGKVQAESAERTQAALRNLDSDAPSVTLKLPDYRLAHLLARLNRLAAQGVLLTVLGVIVGGYLRRFNAPVASAFPLPLAGAWVDAVSRKAPLVVEWTAASGPLTAYLETVLRKGQSFLYVGDRVTPAALDTRRLRWRRWGAWPMPLLVLPPTNGRDAAQAVPRAPEFVLDAIWFGRSAVLVSAAEGGALLSSLADRLSERVATRASARRLPHLVVDGDVRLPDALWSRLKVLGPETGLRVVRVVGDS